MVALAGSVLGADVLGPGEPLSPDSRVTSPLDELGPGVSRLPTPIACVEPWLDPDDPTSTAVAGGGTAPAVAQGGVPLRPRHAAGIRRDVLRDAPKQSPPA